MDTNNEILSLKNFMLNWNEYTTIKWATMIEKSNVKI